MTVLASAVNSALHWPSRKDPSNWVLLCKMRHRSTGWKVAVSLLCFVTGVSFYLNLSVSVWILSRHKLQQKWIPGVSPEGNGGRFVSLTNLPPTCVDCLEILGS